MTNPIIYNALSYGGTFNDVSANAAIAAAQAAGSGIVFLPAGTWLIAATLAITTAGVSIAGAGPGATILQPTSPISGSVISVTGADNVVISDLSIKGASTTYSSNPAATAILVNHSNSFKTSNVNVSYNNGAALQVNSDATGDSYWPQVTNFHALSCASGIQLIGTASTDHNMGAFLVNCICDQIQNGDSVQLLDVHDVTIVNLEGSNFSASGNVVHIKGLCAAIFVMPADIGALNAGAAANGATVLIETGTLGNPKQITFTGGILENGLTGVSITAGSEILFSGVEFIKNGTHGASISGAADLVSFQGCTFDQNGFTAGAGHYDISDSSTGHVSVEGCTFNTPVGSGSSQVASACNFTAGSSYCFNNEFNGATPFTTVPTVARSNPGYNPVGQVTAPAFPATTVAAVNNTQADVTAYIANGTAAITVVQIAGLAGTYVTTGYQIAASGFGSVRIPVGGGVKFTYASGTPTWTWFGD